MFIQRLDNKLSLMQISIAVRQLERMTTRMQITCTIWWQQMMMGMTCTTDLF